MKSVEIHGGQLLLIILFFIIITIIIIHVFQQLHILNHFKNIYSARGDVRGPPSTMP